MKQIVRRGGVEQHGSSTFRGGWGDCKRYAPGNFLSRSHQKGETSPLFGRPQRRPSQGRDEQIP